MTPSKPAKRKTAAPKTDKIFAQARAIHDRVLVLDSHIDFEPEDLTGERNYTQRIETQFNLPNMIDGGLDGLFFVIYVGQTKEAQNSEAFKAAGYQRAYKAAVEKFDAVRRFTSEIAPEQIELAFSADDIRRIHAHGKKAALMGVENGYPLGEDLPRVKEFYDRGARYISLTHNGHNQLGDSHTGERDGWKWHGVSPLGKQVIGEMNRLGIMVDVSHASKEAMLKTAALSKADRVIQIPMLGFVQSLNVSVATAVVLWEIIKQKKESHRKFSLPSKDQKNLQDSFIHR